MNVYLEPRDWFYAALALSGTILAVCWIRAIIVNRRLRDLTEAVENGKTCLFSSRAGIFSHRNLDRLQRACNDLVARSLQANRDRQDSLQQIQSTLGNLREGVVMIDSDHLVLMANDAFRQFIGREQPVVGQRLETLLHSAELLDFLRALRSGERRAGEEIEIRRGRESLHFEISGTRLPENPGQKETATVLVLHDITGRKRLEEMRSEFVANVSHELRTPVTVIKGFAETLIEDHRDLSVEDRERFLLKITNNASRLHALLEDLLTLSRLESEAEELRRAEVNLAGLASEIVDNSRVRLPSSQILEVVCHNPGLTASLDPVKITQVIENLIDNALKHARGASRVVIHIGTRDGKVEVMVEDNGCGIPAGDILRIFERFYRVDKGRSRERGGTGLGLAIVKHIVQLHGGTVWAESEEGVGTRIGFRLPMNTNDLHKSGAKPMAS